MYSCCGYNKIIMRTLNTNKTTSIVFKPCNRFKTVSDSFPQFTLAGCKLKVVEQFKYLGHLIHNSFSDDNNINREIKAMFTRTNLLCRRFKRCSTVVKLRLFQSYCICLYDSALWNNFTVAAINRLASCYVKCMKTFFGYSKFSSVTGMLLDLRLPSFTTLLHNYKIGFSTRLAESDNTVVRCTLKM